MSQVNFFNLFVSRSTTLLFDSNQVEFFIEHVKFGRHKFLAMIVELLAGAD